MLSGGAPWSLWVYLSVNSQRRQGLRDQISLSPILLSFFRWKRKATRIYGSVRTFKRREWKRRTQLDGDGSVRQLKEEIQSWRWRNSIQEWIRERINGFASKAIKWSTPIVEQHGEKMNYYVVIQPYIYT